MYEKLCCTDISSGTLINKRYVMTAMHCVKEGGKTANDVKVREAAKKILLLMAGPLRGGGAKRQGHKEKKKCFWNLFSSTFA